MYRGIGSSVGRGFTTCLGLTETVLVHVRGIVVHLAFGSQYLQCYYYSFYYNNIFAADGLASARCLGRHARVRFAVIIITPRSINHGRGRGEKRRRPRSCPFSRGSRSHTAPSA